MAGSVRNRRWLFGDVVLDETALELSVKGKLVHIEPKQLEALLFLLHHAGEVVTKDELQDNVWPGRVLSESVLTRCISGLRAVIGDRDKALIRTVHGFGYRLDAKPRIESGVRESAPVFGLKAGDSPPMRDQWKLVERLGTGGHGEAWLARHEKTHDAKVFKFAIDEGSLTSLKREITLYRVLHDSLPGREDFLHIAEWNLEQRPYFLEIDYARSGNLKQWAEAKGGLSSLSLETRVQLAARIAEALAAAHSVGVLHKDLKPSNILVDDKDSDVLPRIRVCDFGSGGVLDEERLKSLGITRRGFTHALAVSETTGGTPVYIAPEVLAGQPFTVKADIYALGVILYQLLAGNLERPLAAGWEADIGDELLREDILEAAAGNPERRLSDAAVLADRLRNLETRRAARAEEAEARVRLEQERQTRRELRRTRAFAAVVGVLGALAIGGGIAAYKARNEAVAATTTAQAINDFLTEGVLRVDPATERPKDATYASLLRRAAAGIDERLGNEPEAAAKIHWLLGRRFHQIGDAAAAMGHYEKAAELFTQVYGRDADETLLVLDRLVWVYSDSQPERALAISEKILERWESRLGEGSLAFQVLRTRIAGGQAMAGKFSEGEEELRAVLKGILNATLHESNRPLIDQWLGMTLSSSTSQIPESDFARLARAYAELSLSNFVLFQQAAALEEAVLLANNALTTFSEWPDEVPELVAGAELALAVALASQGKVHKADKHLARARRAYSDLLPANHYQWSGVELALAHLRIEQRRFADSIKATNRALAFCRSNLRCGPVVLETIRYFRGTAQLENKEAALAAGTLRDSLAAISRLRPGTLWPARTRLGLASALLESKRIKEARSILSKVNMSKVFREDSLHMAELHRVQGLLLADEGQIEDAIGTLAEARTLLERMIGAEHWRTRRVAQTLEELRARR